MKDPYSNLSDALWDAEFAVLENEPQVNVLEWLYFEAIAREGKRYLNQHLSDCEAI